MTRTILDLTKPKTTVFDLSNVLNPRVNDDLVKISFHIQYGNKPFNMTGYKMYFISADENMGYINIDGMIDKIEVGDNVGNGDVTFRFPPNVFKKAGTFDSTKTMFVIENVNSNYIQSTINISLTVLENSIAKFNADVDQIGYDSKLEQIHEQYKNKAKNLIDELINQAQTANNFNDVKATAEQAKETANDSIAKANAVNNEVITARSRFSNLNDRLNNQDIKINAAETTTNANANYNRLTEKDLSQDKMISNKVDKVEIESRLNNQDEKISNKADKIEIESRLNNQDEKISNKADKVDFQQISNRINQLTTTPASDGTTEVNDARVGATSLGGVTYENLGSSIRGQIDTLNGKVISADMIKLNALNIKPYASYGKEIAYYDTGTKKPVLREKADAISVDMSVSEMPARISFKASNSTQKIIFYKANSKAANISNSNETTFQQSYGLYECHNGYFTIKTDSFALNGFDRVAFALDIMYQEVLDVSNDLDGKTLLDWYKKTGTSYHVSLSMFSNFGVLGDSYSVGTLYRDDTWKSVFKLQWPQLIARKWGITAKTFSKGGLSTRTWLTDDVGLKALKDSDVQDLYCICLGINDNAILSKDPSYLGTTDNIGDNSDTFYGNYSRIVSEVKTKAPHSKIICFGLSQTVEYYPQITNAIRNIAKTYNVPFVDLLSNDFFKSTWYNSMLGGHPVGPVYGGMATAYESLIQNAIQNNSDYFADYGFY